MAERKKPGRPSKLPPVVDPSAVERVKQMAKEYSDAKLRSRYFENSRRSLIRRASVDLQQSEEQGIAIYDKDEVSGWPKIDKAAINQYINDKQTVLCIEHGVASIKDERTREIAEKTIIEGKSCARLVDEMHIPRPTLFREKDRALHWIAYHLDSKMRME